MKDSTGRFLTKALFIEYSDGRYTPKFTLNDHDTPTGEKSLRRLYMSYEDPLEGKFAEEVFGNRQHWKKLCELQWFMPYIQKWREDLEEKLASRGFEYMKEHSAKSPQAAKWLAEKGWKPKNSRGRPSQAEIEAKRKEKAEEEDFYSSAAGRIWDDD